MHPCKIGKRQIFSNQNELHKLYEEADADLENYNMNMKFFLPRLDCSFQKNELCLTQQAVNSSLR